mgnify:CR=1 FL=1
MKWYKPLCTFEVIADNCYYPGARSQPIYLHKDQEFSVWNKQKDLFDDEHEYWMTRDGWILKIEKKHLPHLVEVNDL